MKSVISKGISDTLTAIYTNTTGQDAAMKAFNVNTSGTDIINTTGASEWTFFGDSYTFGDAAGDKNGIPYFIRLTDTRVLVLFTMHGKGQANSTVDGTVESNSVVYAQILEYQGTKYVAGRITRLVFPTDLSANSPFYAGANNMPYMHGIALTPTKVVLSTYVASGQTFLFNLNITGNTVSPTIYSLQITGAGSPFGATTSLNMRVAKVNDNTNKVIVGGYNASSQYTVAAFNVTGSANPTLSGAASTVAGITGDTQRVSYVSEYRRSDNTYICAAYTNASSISASIFTYNSTTDAFTLVNTNALGVSTASVSSANILLIGCMSDGADYNAIITTNNATTVGSFMIWRQTSGTAITTAPTTISGFSSGSQTTKRFVTVDNWGNKRVVFAGNNNYLFGYNSLGSETNLSIAGTSNTYASAFWIPFNARPLYATCGNTQGGGGYQYLAAQVSPSSADDFGTATVKGNYLPIGFPGGRNYAWNPVCNCWTIGFGVVIYNVSTTGEIISEASYTNFTSASNPWGIRNVVITPTGRIALMCDNYGSGNGTVAVTSDWLTGALRVINTVPLVTSAIGLNTLTTADFTFFSPNNMSRAVDMIYYQSGSSEKLVGIAAGFATTTRNLYWFDGTVSATAFSAATNGTAISGTSSSSTTCVGRPSMAIIPTGASTGMLVGNITVNYSVSGGILGYGASIALSSLGSSTFTTLITDTQANKGIVFPLSVARYPDGMTVATISYGQTSTATHRNYTWVSNNGSLITPVNGTLSYYPNLLNPVATACKTIGLVTLNSANATSSANTNPVAIAYNATTTAVPYSVTTGTAGLGSLQSYPISKFSVAADGDNVDIIYTSAGNESTKFYMALNNGSSDFYITPITGTTLTTPNSRATDVYYVPNGGSIKVKGEVNGSLDVMLSILEQ